MYVYIYLCIVYSIHMIYWVILLPSSSRWHVYPPGKHFWVDNFPAFPKICEFRLLEGIHPWRLRARTQFPGGFGSDDPPYSFLKSWGDGCRWTSRYHLPGYTYRDPMATSTPFFHTSPKVSPLRGSIYLRGGSPNSIRYTPWNLFNELIPQS